MHLSRAHLDAAVARGLIGADQAEALWRFLAERDADTPAFKPAHILYYLGGMIAIGAMSLFMTLGWQRFGGIGLLLIATVYFAIAIALTEALLHRGLSIPAGITAVLAVVLVPLAVYGVQLMMELWPADRPWAFRDYHRRIDGRWLAMELATLAAGIALLWRYRLPFLVLPVAFTLWYTSMDLTPWLAGGDPADLFSERAKVVSTVFGLLMLAVAFVVDLRTLRTRDFAFWLYVFGVMTFWGGLTLIESTSELGRFVYGCVNLTLIAAGAVLSRRVFAVFGGAGVAFYLGHLSYEVFRDSLLFPVALTAIGLAVVGAGVWWQRHEARLGERLRARLPATVRELVEHRAAA